MTAVLLVAAVAIILFSAELLTNGVDWFGHRFNLGEGAVGSVLTAVGTALPETLIPILAILPTGGAGAGERICDDTDNYGRLLPREPQ